MKRYELAVIRRAVGRVAQAVGKRRVIVTADRGFADVALFTLLSQLGVTFIIRVQAGTHVAFQGKWRKLGQLRFRGNERHRRFGGEEGFRDAKWWLGFTKARIAQIKAWSRMFALFAMALLVMTSLGSKLLLAQGHRAKDLLRRVVSRRRGRCELGLVSAMVSLLQRDKTLYNDLCPHVKLKLEATSAIPAHT